MKLEFKTLTINISEPEPAVNTLDWVDVGHITTMNIYTNVMFKHYFVIYFLLSIWESYYGKEFHDIVG